MQEATNQLIWVDLEMTGLDPAKCTIVEIATIVTDSQLNLVAEGPSIVIHHGEDVLEQMNQEVKAMHTKSGLIEKIRESRTSLKEAENLTLQFLSQYCLKNKSPLCGNSVWKDRAFLEVYMPTISDFIHYRTIDVSTIKELVRRWYSAELNCPKKKESHRALDDIFESIEELKWYRSKVFI